MYSPASSWHASSVPCSTCLAPSPSIAFQGTWHDGTHIIPTEDSDDLPTNANNAAQPSPTPSKAAGDDADDGKKDDDDKKDGDDVDAKNKDDDSDSDDGKGKKGDKDDGKRRRRHLSTGSHLLRRQTATNDASSNPFFTPNLDSDDPGFVDTPVSAQLNFTGA